MSSKNAACSEISLCNVFFEKEGFLYTEEKEHEQELVDKLEWQECVQSKDVCFFTL